MMVWLPVVASYCTVPPQVSPVGNGAPDVFWVLIVPVLLTVVPPRVKVAILKISLALVLLLRVVTVILPLAVCVPLVLPKVKIP